MNPETYEHMKMALVSGGFGMMVGTLIGEVVIIISAFVI